MKERTLEILNWISIAVGIFAAGILIYGIVRALL